MCHGIFVLANQTFVVVVVVVETRMRRQQQAVLYCSIFGSRWEASLETAWFSNFRAEVPWAFKSFDIKLVSQASPLTSSDLHTFSYHATSVTKKALL